MQVSPSKSITLFEVEIPPAHLYTLLLFAVKWKAVDAMGKDLKSLTIPVGSAEKTPTQPEDFTLSAFSKAFTAPAEPVAQ